MTVSRRHFAVRVTPVWTHALASMETRLSSMSATITSNAFHDAVSMGCATIFSSATHSASRIKIALARRSKVLVWITQDTTCSAKYTKDAAAQIYAQRQSYVKETSYLATSVIIAPNAWASSVTCRSTSVSALRSLKRSVMNMTIVKTLTSRIAACRWRTWSLSPV